MIRLHLTNREENCDRVNEQGFYIYSVCLVYRDGIKIRFDMFFCVLKGKVTLLLGALEGLLEFVRNVMLVL